MIDSKKEIDRLKEELAEALENQRRLRVELDNTLVTLQEYRESGERTAER